jgi:hypothetical protein
MTPDADVLPRCSEERNRPVVKTRRAGRRPPSCPASSHGLGSPERMELYIVEIKRSKGPSLLK